MATSRFLTVDGIRTHFLEAGAPDRPALILLHGGEFGASAELAYERNIDVLAKSHHVVVPDMLGYGSTDKIVEFGAGVRHGRRIKHLKSLVRALDIRRATWIGNSMGGALLMQDIVSETPMLPIDRFVSINGHAATQLGARAALQNFDGSREAMKGVLETLFRDPIWTDPAYVDRRLTSALVPGAFEAAVAARVRLPGPVSTGLPSVKDVPYERVALPTLIISGAHDICCPEWGEEAASRIPASRHVVFENSAHCPQLEEADQFNATVAEFLSEV